MRQRAGLAVLVTSATLLACSSSRIPACPGDPIVTLAFRAVLRAGEGGCTFASSTPTAESAGVRTSFDFTGIVATASDGAALLCLQRPEASPLRGSLDGDQLAVAGPTSAAYVTVCACSLDLAETLAGTLTTFPDGSVFFAGTLRNVLSVLPGVDPATCEPAPTASAPGPTCGAPCELRWTVTASR